jgi:hypothetical protein
MFGRFSQKIRFKIAQAVLFDSFEFERFGIDHSYLSVSTCYTHGEPPVTAKEDLEMGEEGIDVCIVVSRLLGGDKHLAVQLESHRTANHQ